MRFDEFLDDDRVYEHYMRHFKEEVLPAIEESRLFVAIAPTPGHVDSKLFLEVGAAVVLDRPIVVLAGEGREVSESLRKVARTVVEHVDFTSTEGQAFIAGVLSAVVQELEVEDGAE